MQYTRSSPPRVKHGAQAGARPTFAGKWEPIQKREREEREQERLRECTFAPRTNHGAVGARLNKPVVVHGLTRFLRNREAARRKDEEKRRREKEAAAAR